METTLKNICDLHGLIAITASMFDAKGSGSISVYVHWTDEYEIRHCATGMAQTFDEALALALTEKCLTVLEAA